MNNNSAFFRGLKKCPFCGSEAKLEDHRTIWVVRCVKCEACVLGDRIDEEDIDSNTLTNADYLEYEQSAIIKWNTRENK